jgi:hypothetical protein
MPTSRTVGYIGLMELPPCRPALLLRSMSILCITTGTCSFINCVIIHPPGPAKISVQLLQQFPVRPIRSYNPIPSVYSLHCQMDTRTAGARARPPDSISLDGRSRRQLVCRCVLAGSLSYIKCKKKTRLRSHMMTQTLLYPMGWPNTHPTHMQCEAQRYCCYVLLNSVPVIVTTVSRNEQSSS